MFSQVIASEIFLIRRKDFVDPRFFLQEFDYEKYNFLYARWTANKQRASEFRTEEAVETFKFEFLQHYPCEIIRL